MSPTRLNRDQRWCIVDSSRRRRQFSLGLGRHPSAPIKSRVPRNFNTSEQGSKPTVFQPVKTAGFGCVESATSEGACSKVSWPALFGGLFQRFVDRGLSDLSFPGQLIQAHALGWVLQYCITINSKLRPADTPAFEVRLACVSPEFTPSLTSDRSSSGIAPKTVNCLFQNVRVFNCFFLGAEEDSSVSTGLRTAKPNER